MSERWERTTSLFNAARQLDAADRLEFLRVACGQDVELRQEVDRLLAADTTDDDDFLRTPAWVLDTRTPDVLISVGQIINDRYRIDAELGSGGQGQVFRATDRSLSRDVVVKVMHTVGRKPAWLKQRFASEMQALVRISHPGVVGIVDVGQLDDATPYLVIEFIPGKSLRESLIDGPLPAATAARIIREMGSALHAAHSVQIAHRDLKPENVMLRKGPDVETVCLIDFGLAKIEADGLLPDTRTVIIAGTVRYMAPEQLEGTHSLRSDVYSFALIACEMLSGRPDVRALPQSVPRDAVKALEAALAYAPDDRPANVEQWSGQLAAALERQQRRPRTLRRALAVLGAVALVCGSVYAVVDREGEPQRVIEHVGGFDPVDEGFQSRHDLTLRIVAKPDFAGFEAYRLITRDQGYLYHPFTAAQKRLALARGWRLVTTHKVDSGASTVGADFFGVSRRFSVTVLNAGDSEIVQLTTQVVPDIRGLEVVQRPSRQYHTYELVYDPNLESVGLWIDGTLRISNYRGYSQYQDNTGLLFGTFAYKSGEGVATYKLASFSINP